MQLPVVQIRLGWCSETTNLFELVSVEIHWLIAFIQPGSIIFMKLFILVRSFTSLPICHKDQANLALVPE